MEGGTGGAPEARPSGIDRKEAPLTGYIEVVVVAGGQWEYFCRACSSLRLYAKDASKPTACGNCGSAELEVDELGSKRLDELRAEGRAK